MKVLAVRNLVRNVRFLRTGLAFLSSSNNNWEAEFNPQIYLRTRYPHPRTVKNHFAEFLLTCLHRFRTNLASSSVRVLEYGCGPVPIHTAGLAGQASEIILAEYLEKNREEVKKWLREEKSSYNWTPYIQYLVQTVEGLTEEGAVVARERKLKEVIKAVIPCNILEDPPIEHDVKGGYDVILSVFCIEAGTRTNQEYLHAIQKLTRLLKPGGYLLLFSGRWELSRAVEEGCGYYSVGNSIFYNVPVTRELVLHALKECGGCDLYTVEMECLPDTYKGIQSDISGFIFSSAKFV